MSCRTDHLRTDEGSRLLERPRSGPLWVRANWLVPTTLSLQESIRTGILGMCGILGTIPWGRALLVSPTLIISPLPRSASRQAAHGHRAGRRFVARTQTKVLGECLCRVYTYPLFSI